MLHLKSSVVFIGILTASCRDDRLCIRRRTTAVFPAAIKPHRRADARLMRELPLSLGMSESDGL